MSSAVVHCECGHMLSSHGPECRICFTDPPCQTFVQCDCNEQDSDDREVAGSG